jgi:hypothetical protein
MLAIGVPWVSSYASSVAIRSFGVLLMPLNSAKLPSPCRKKRSIGIIRSIAFNSIGGGAMFLAANVCRSGSRSSSSSISALGLREMCPPSGRICRCSSSDRRRVTARL